MNSRGYTDDINKHLIDAWRVNTRKTYNVPLRKWRTFCVEKGIEPLNPCEIMFPLQFLCRQFQAGLGYSAINVARSALSNVLPLFSYENPNALFKFGVHPDVVQLLKSFYNKRPPKTRYAEFWDPEVVLDQVRSYWPHCRVLMSELSWKLAFLLTVCSSRRLDTLINIKISDIVFTRDGCKILISTVEKHSRVGCVLGMVPLDIFKEDPKVCVVTCLRDYLYYTKGVRSAKKGSLDVLFISHRPPYLPITTQTLAKWVKKCLHLAGIDSKVYGAHSAKGAVASKLFVLNLSVNDIMQRAEWKTESVFRKFYNKNVTKRGSTCNAIQESFHANFAGNTDDV